MNWDYMDALEQLLNRARHGGRNRPLSTSYIDGSNTYSPSLPPGMADTYPDIDVYPSRAASVSANRRNVVAYIDGSNTYSPSLPPGMADTGADFDMYPSRAGSVANNRETARELYGTTEWDINPRVMRALGAQANARGKRWR